MDKTVTSNGIIKERVTARVDDELVVFLIGMRINKPWKVTKWLPVARAMTRMINELEAAPELGFRHVESWFGRTTMMLQYWESIDKLMAYASDRNAAHLPAWRDFNKAVASNGDVGIWHETYRVTAGNFESVYNNMPRFGLAQAFPCIPASGAHASAKSRMAQTASKRVEVPISKVANGSEHH